MEAARNTAKATQKKYFIIQFFLCIQRALNERRINYEPQGSLMLVGNPVSSAGDQIQVRTSQIAKDILKRSCLRCIVGNACDPEMQYLPSNIRHLYIIAYLYIS